jgi:hypothetical protein
VALASMETAEAEARDDWTAARDRLRLTLAALLADAAATLELLWLTLAALLDEAAAARALLWLTLAALLDDDADARAWLRAILAASLDEAADARALLKLALARLRLDVHMASELDLAAAALALLWDTSANELALFSEDKDLDASMDWARLLLSTLDRLRV